MWRVVGIFSFLPFEIFRMEIPHFQSSFIRDFGSNSGMNDLRDHKKIEFSENFCTRGRNILQGLRNRIVKTGFENLNFLP